MENYREIALLRSRFHHAPVAAGGGGRRSAPSRRVGLVEKLPRIRLLAESTLAHYDRLFEAKSAAARRDVFFVMSGAWRSPAERFFLWISGFRPSDLLAVLSPQLETEEPLAPLALTEAHAEEVRRTSRQAEGELSQRRLDELAPLADLSDQGNTPWGCSPETKKRNGEERASVERGRMDRGTARRYISTVNLAGGPGRSETCLYVAIDRISVQQVH
uniref:Bzip protein n=1 Tax=Brachypodium distachyon TaxID=15368 RepID=C3SA97_BRADI|nr:bzip protein [Brachypodium distachyon]